MHYLCWIHVTTSQKKKWEKQQRPSPELGNSKIKNRNRAENAKFEFSFRRESKVFLEQSSPSVSAKEGEVFQERKESASLEKSQDSCFCPRQLPGAPRKHHSATGSILKQPGLCWACQNSSFSRNSRIAPALGTAPPPGAARGDFGECS